MGHDAFGRFGPDAITDGVCQGAGGVLGERVRRHREPAGLERIGRALARKEDRQHRHRPFDLQSGRANAGGDLFGVRYKHRHVQDDDGVDAVPLGQDLEGIAVRLAGCRRDHVDRVVEARCGWQELGQFGLDLVRYLRHDQTVRLARVGAQDAGSTAVGQDGDAVALGSRLVGQERRHVEELAQSVGADDAGLLEERVHRDVRGAEQGARMGRGRPRAGRRAAALDHEDRLLATDSPGDPGELARVAERFQIERNHVRCRVFGPILDEIVARQISLVADRDERRKAKRQTVGVLDDRQAQGARLRQEADVALEGRIRREGGVHSNVVAGVDHAHAVGADDTYAALAGDGQQLALHLLAGRARLGEAGRDHDHAVDALLSAFTGGLHRELGRNDDHSQIHRARDVQDGLVGADRLDHVRAGVDRVDRAVEAAIQEVVEHLAADGPALATGADNRHGTGSQHAAHGVHRRDLLAGLEAGLRLGGERCREFDTDGARSALHGDAEAAVAEHVEHLVVFDEHFGFEDRHALGVGGLGQPLQQQCPKAAALERTIVGEPFVARLAHDFAAEDREHAAILAVDAGPAARRDIEVHGARPESEATRLLGQSGEERGDGRLVGRVAGSDTHRRAVSEDCIDVTGPVSRAHAAAFILRGPACRVGRRTRSASNWCCGRRVNDLPRASAIGPPPQ